MKRNRLLIVPPEIARLASELIQFQWFLDEGSIEESCDVVCLTPDGEVMILLNDLRDRIADVDGCLAEISEPDRYVKADAIEGLIVKLEENGDLLKKLLVWLSKHDSSGRVTKDATALKQDYDFFRKALLQWLEHDTMEAAPAPAPRGEEPNNGGAREMIPDETGFHLPDSEG